MLRNLSTSLGIVLLASTFAIAGQSASQPSNTSKDAIPASPSAQKESTTQAPAQPKHHTKKKHHKHHKKQTAAAPAPQAKQ
jgi:hypothetical protein